MIGYIKGIVEEIGVDYTIVENKGIGYKLNVSSNTIANLKQGEEVKIFSKMIVREDDISLCGFYSKEEEEMFNLLTSVSKIGTKVGLSILSFGTPAKLSQYILAADTKSLAKAPGVGKKTAERIVLELKDKVVKLSFAPEEGDFDAADLINTASHMDDSVEALMGLGYSKAEAEDAVLFVKQPGMSVEEIIKKALVYIAKTSMKF